MINDNSATQPLTNNDMSELDKENDQILDELYESVTQGKIVLDNIIDSANHAGKSKGVDPAPICLRSGRSIQRQPNADSRLYPRTP